MTLTEDLVQAGRGREAAIHQACSWLDQQATAKVLVEFKMCNLDWMEGRTNE
jgi:hypothetical protein